MSGQSGSKSNSEKTFDAKWPEIKGRGYVQVPKCLITCQAELGLKPQELAVLLNIMEKCWVKGDVAWPTVNTLATSIGRKNSATRDITKSLKQNSFITKKQRYNKSNHYGLEPTAKKLAEHLKHCKHYAKNPESEHQESGGPSRQESGGLDSQNTSDYIEPELIRNPYLKPLYGPDSLLGSHDKIYKGGVMDMDDAGNMVTPKHEHIWTEFTQERGRDENDEPIIYYYRTCAIESCGLTRHKKGAWPWKGEYPVEYFEEV